MLRDEVGEVAGRSLPLLADKQRRVGPERESGSFFARRTYNDGTGNDSRRVKCIAEVFESTAEIV
jgi:hypothetical protein